MELKNSKEKDMWEYIKSCSERTEMKIFLLLTHFTVCLQCEEITLHVLHFPITSFWIKEIGRMLFIPQIFYLKYSIWIRKSGHFFMVHKKYFSTLNNLKLFDTFSASILKYKTCTLYHWRDLNKLKICKGLPFFDKWFIYKRLSSEDKKNFFAYASENLVQDTQFYNNL